MRYIFGAIALTAALVIVGYSATTLFTAAYTSMSVEWAAKLAGAGIAAVVAWEATAMLLIGNCIRTRSYAVAFGASLMLLLAMAYTLRYELRMHVGGQADIIAQRTDVIARTQEMRNELDGARERRDALAVLKRPTPAQREQLKAERERIGELERKWDTRTVVVAEPMPEASWTARLTGWNEQFCRDIWTAVGVIFWMVARVFAFPAAVEGMKALWNREDDPGAAKASPQSVTHANPLPPVLAATPPAETAKPTLATKDGKRVKGKDLKRLEKAQHIARRWMADFAPPASGIKRVTANEARKHHAAWAKGKCAPLAPNWLGRALASIEGLDEVVTDRSSGKGATYIFNSKRHGGAVQVKAA